MKPNPIENLARGLALGAGLLDFCTGLGLVLAPALTLRLMRAGPVGAEAEIYLRFTGVFVGLVGFSYLWGLAGGPARLRAVLMLTTWFRLAVGGFSAWAVAAGRLTPAWSSVPATDLLLAAAQAWLLWRGIFPNER
jgi:hypothetical protein